MSGFEPTVFDDVMPMSEQARWAGDSKLFVQFYRRAIKNDFESEQQNRPVFYEVDYIKIITPGDKLAQIDAPVDDHYKQRFAAKYDAYLKNQGANYRVGTPVEAWPTLTISQVAELKFLNIHTVEDLVNCSDANGQKIMGFPSLKKKAKAFLEASDEALQEKKLQEKVTAAVEAHEAAKAVKPKPVEKPSLIDK